MFSRCEHVITKKSGNTIQLIIEKRPHIYKGEKVCALSISDNTEHHFHLKTIREQQEQIVDGARLSAIGEMASGIAHEINNPLFIITSKVRVLQKLLDLDRLDIEKFKQIVSTVDLTAHRISNIIKGMRAISRNAENDPLERVSVRTVLDETLILCQKKIQTSDVKMILQESFPENAYVLARESQLIQVLLNLFNNAVDAIEGQNEKWISIEIVEEDNIVKIRIFDSGKGISKSNELKIFTPFYTSKEPGKGTGLGLSLSKKIIESFGGKIYIDHDHENTCFVLEFKSDAEEEKNVDMSDEDLMAL